MRRLMDPPPQWAIDQNDTGQYFLKLPAAGGFHTSDGLGDGIVSLLVIVDALYDSQPGHTIAIDEPELSLHPHLQQKLATLLVDYAKDRQVILATHSPYFASPAAIAAGAELARVYKDGTGCHVASLSQGSRVALRTLLNNANNPHVLGLSAREAFFLHEGVVLLEGQEDVIFYSRVEQSLGVALLGNVYGWGAGGADNIRIFCGIFRDLGFRKVVAIVDRNREELLGPLREAFPEYAFHSIPAADVRTKAAKPGTTEVKGLLDDKNQHVRPEYAAEVRGVFERANSYLASAAST
jgi:hypothetical protein